MNNFHWTYLAKHGVLICQTSLAVKNVNKNLTWNMYMNLNVCVCVYVCVQFTPGQPHKTKANKTKL